LRNFITHGIKTNGETYAVPTTAAVERISHYVEVITAPVRVIDLFKKEVFTAKTTDLVKSIIPQMKEKNYTAVPIYDAQ
jgi:hypothetical protein